MRDRGPKGPFPWDTAIALIITIVGFGYTIQNFSRKHFLTHARPLAEEVAYAEGLSPQTLDLGCIEDRAMMERVLRDGGPIRVKGRLCRLGSANTTGIDNIRVKNLSNGHEATVYFQGDYSSFITDFINLDTGKNSLEVRWRETQGKPLRAFVAEVIGGVTR